MDMETEKIEIELLLLALKRRYGYDFTDYKFSTARRRVLQRLAVSGLSSVSALQHLILHDRKAADQLASSLSINVTEMFRDPPFFQAVRQSVLPHLSHQERFKIWHAGCASGEEVYAMAILLKEAGLYEKATLFGTDFNHDVLEKARAGIIPMDQMQQTIHNYQASGGHHEFAAYYHARYEGAIMDKRLKQNMVFSQHDLTRDAPFGTFDMIVCRNVLIYFNSHLKTRVFNLFADSLAPGGFLCLGTHESLGQGPVSEYFNTVDAQMRIFQKATP